MISIVFSYLVADDFNRSLFFFFVVIQCAVLHSVAVDDFGSSLFFFLIVLSSLFFTLPSYSRSSSETPLLSLFFALPLS